MLSVVLRKVKDGEVDRLRSWMAELNERQDEVRETFAQEGVMHERAYLLEMEKGPVLVYAIEARDFEAASRAYNDSTLPIDLEHRKVMSKVLAEPADADLVYECQADASPVRLVEFPADDPDRARRFWHDVLGVALVERTDDEGRGWQTHFAFTDLGVHQRGTGPGERFSIPYFAVAELEDVLMRVRANGGEVIHASGQWAICRDSEGSPFGLMLEGP